MADKKFDKCIVIDHPNLQKGYGCCKCRTFNGNQRTNCKQCGHTRCDGADELDDLPPVTKELLN